jgi:hypothetical protein
MGIDNLYVWVYHYEIAEGEAKVKHTTYRTQDSIQKCGGVALHKTGKQVPGYEVTDGIWKPDRTPIT